MPKEWKEVVMAPADKTWDRLKPIEGEIVRVQQDVGPNSSKLYTLKTDDGEVAVWGSTTLDTKFAELYLHDQVKIEPLGKVKSPKTGREYWDFKVSFIEGDRKEKAQSGYDKAKEQADKIREDEVADVSGDEEIDVSTIPF